MLKPDRGDVRACRWLLCQTWEAKYANARVISRVVHLLARNVYIVGYLYDCEARTSRIIISSISIGRVSSLVPLGWPDKDLSPFMVRIFLTPNLWTWKRTDFHPHQAFSLMQAAMVAVFLEIRRNNNSRRQAIVARSKRPGLISKFEFSGVHRGIIAINAGTYSEKESWPKKDRHKGR